MMTAFLRRLLELLEGLQLQRYVLAYAGSLDVIVCGDFVGLRAVVVPVNLMSEFAFLAVVVVNRVEQLLVEIHPLLESELLAEYARSDVPVQSSAASMGMVPEPHIGSIRSHSPRQPAHQYHAGGQHLVQRGLHGFLAITAAVQRLAGLESRDSVHLVSAM